jgi:hypothetical protein
MAGLRELKTPQLETAAHLTLAEALLSEGRARDAGLALSRAKALNAQRRYRTLRFDAAMTEAKLLAGAGASAQAMKQLGQVLDEAAQCGYTGYRLEAGRLLAEIELRSGKPDAGRNRLKAVEQEAAAKGFGLVAAKAAALSARLR